ncbi:MAG TPA: hypothetical protein VF527_17080 [Pyrinomonadaceae bacterium]|jgi:uncharacterized membrane protein YeaQ/YmgE (transglycosylase-associated protein family)
MLLRVLRFVRLPLVLLVIWTIARFSIGLAGTPYAPRGNAMFSIASVTIICALVYGAMSNRVGNFNWVGTILIGVVLGLFAQILIFTATLISYAADLDTYFRHWDALNLPEGTTVPMAKALTSRAGGVLVGPIMGAVVALIGRAVFGKLAPRGDEAGDR